MRIFAIILVLLLQFQLLVITTNCSSLEIQEEHNHMKVVENKQVYIAALRKIGGRGITGTHASRGGHGLGEGASTTKDEVATVGGLRNSKFVDVDVVAAGAGIAAAEEAAIAAGEGAAVAAAGEAAEGAAAAAAGEAAEGAHTAANTAAATAAAATASVASEARSISPNAPFGLTLCLVLASSGLLLLPEF
ncbi:spidroin-1-like [Chenopodium quinoa]|uniref:spidroin-1-like n=1 Tax=Chenopodium quinoa TaxID=63459 RepID=UPI000B78E993|nr:spidroin-1-like [Chenopodium quinoa]